MTPEQQQKQRYQGPPSEQLREQVARAHGAQSIADKLRLSMVGMPEDAETRSIESVMSSALSADPGLHRAATRHRAWMESDPNVLPPESEPEDQPEEHEELEEYDDEVLGLLPDVRRQGIERLESYGGTATRGHFVKMKLAGVSRTRVILREEFIRAFPHVLPMQQHWIGMPNRLSFAEIEAFYRGLTNDPECKSHHRAFPGMALSEEEQWSDDTRAMLTDHIVALLKEAERHGITGLQYLSNVDRVNVTVDEGVYAIHCAMSPSQFLRMYPALARAQVKWLRDNRDTRGRMAMKEMEAFRREVRGDGATEMRSDAGT